MGCVGVDGKSGWRAGSDSGQGLYRRPPAILSSREPHGQANRARQQGRWRRPGQHGRAASRRPQRVLQVWQCVWEGGRRTRQRCVVLVVSRSVRRRLESSTKALEQSLSEILPDLAELPVNGSPVTLYSTTVEFNELDQSVTCSRIGQSETRFCFMEDPPSTRVYSTIPILFAHPGKAIAVVNGIG